MANTLFIAPTSNYFSTTLSGAISDSATTITLSSVTGLQAPGYLILDREDGSGNATPDAREVIYYTGISSNDLTGVSRGADSSTARSHADGALVEATPTVGMWNSLATILNTAVDNSGYLKAIASPVSIGRAELTQAVVPSQASIADVRIGKRIDVVSGASITGIGLHPTFVFTGNLSGPTTLLQAPLVMPQEGTFQWVNVLTRTVASTSSVIIDINKNGVSIFDTIGRPGFLPGATMASTASIKTKTFNEGDRISWDLDAPGTGEDGHITDLTIILRAA